MLCLSLSPEVWKASLLFPGILKWSYQPSLVQSSVSTTSTSKQHGCDAPRPLLLLVQTSVLPAALAYCTS
jgi:hypothetical protein